MKSHAIGSLVSVYTCFFYNDAGSMSNQFHVGVFRQMGDNYTQISQFAVTWRVDSSETQGCIVVNMGKPQQVFEGDKLAVHVRRKCRNNGVCPLQPILRTSSSVSVFFIGAVNVTDIPVTRFDKRKRYTNVYLDVSASIGKLCNIGSIGLTLKHCGINSDVVLVICDLRFNNFASSPASLLFNPSS